MKITNRSTIKRVSCKKPSYDFTSIDKQPLNFRRDSMPITSIAVMHYTKRQTCPNMHFASDFNYSPNVQDLSTVARISTRGYCESSRERQDAINKLDWKILTLRQIKNMKGQIANQQNIKEGQQKGNRKLYVSISKSNRSSMSKQKHMPAEPKLAQVGGDLTLLRSISNKRKIVDMIELQMEENIRTNRFFCN